MKVVRLAVAYQHGDWPMVHYLCDQYGSDRAENREKTLTQKDGKPKAYQFCKSDQDYQHCQIVLGGGLKYFLFSPLLGEDFQFD